MSHVFHDMQFRQNASGLKEFQPHPPWYHTLNRGLQQNGRKQTDADHLKLKKKRLTTSDIGECMRKVCTVQAFINLSARNNNDHPYLSYNVGVITLGPTLHPLLDTHPLCSCPFAISPVASFVDLSTVRPRR